ncbi:MAG: putative porin [Bacteroides sp.]|nr:putative porin [Bacteroides sp.]
MKRIAITYIILLAGIVSMQAQQTLRRANDNLGNRDQFGNQIDPNMLPDNVQDSTNTELISLPPKLYMWKVSELLGERTIVPADTTSLNFQNSNLSDGTTGEYNHLGNLGAPRLSRIFFNRKDDKPTLFMQPFSSFYVRPDEVLFTNSNIPFTNLTYYKGGNKINGDERFKSYFSVNVNKRLAFGFNIDYLYGRGYYQKQNTSFFNAGIFASYIGEKYQMQAVYNNFNMKMNENGGIADDQYITRPENMAEGKKEYESSTIPVKLEQASNRNKDFYLYLTHRYRLGFYRDRIEVKKDTTTVEEFVPVTSFIHTFKLERSRHNFRASNEPADFFPEKYYLYKNHSNDSTTALSVKNTFGIALLEGFNKYAKAGLTAYISHKFSRYDLMNVDTLTDMHRQRYNEQEVFVGGELAKRQGKLLHYNINGEVGILEKAIGQFRVNADIDLNFRLGKDTVNFFARGRISNTLPSFYMRHYHSNHYTWDNDDMEKEFRTRIEGELNIERWRSNLKVGVENIKNYTYFNQNAMPEQCGDNIQVLSAQLKQDFKLGIFHLDNLVTWQKSSNETVLPLPQLSLYHNLYLLTKLAKKVLTVQLGAELVYFTKYYAPAYAPGIQQFHLQPTADQVEVGGYPFVNAYVNMQLKRTRFYIMATHITQGMGNRNSFTVPHYPVNPRQWFRFGVSWNFYD